VLVDVTGCISNTYDLETVIWSNRKGVKENHHPASDQTN
jgi:hypothetical protein